VGKRIVVNAGLTETRVGVQEGNLLTDLYLERHRQRSIVGSVYKGIVTNVLPGMQAAFVDIGLHKDAFLYAGDYTTNLGDDARAMLAGGDEEGDADVEVEELEARREATAPIEDMLRKGQAVLVQVSKESLGTKGARITSFISLPGRYLVYMPQARHIGVSRRIRDEHERDRLRDALRALSLPPGGFILRTNAEGKGEAEFANDVEFLNRLWAQIQARFESTAAPAALHEEGDLTFRVVRDLLSPDVDEFVVDSKEVYDKCVGYVEALVPALAGRVRLYEDRQPVFETLGIERDIEKALRRRVWLKSGGYIVIDHTEALVSIDVNTGKYVGKRDFEQTVLKINLESVGEVVRQIRLRDLGGIIIIDFIDMEREEHRDQVFKALRHAHQRAADLRARPGRDDAQARAPGPPLAPVRAVPHVPGQRCRQGRGHAGRGDLSRRPRESRGPGRAARARGRRARALRHRALPRGRRGPGGRAARCPDRPQDHGPGEPEPSRPRGVRGPGARRRGRRGPVTHPRRLPGGHR